MSSCQIRQDLKIKEWQRVSANVIIYCESDTYSIGQTLVLHGKTKLFNRARNEGNFDQAAYYKARGISFAVNDVDVKNAYGKRDRIAETMYGWKYYLAGVYECELGAREGGILNTMLLGEKNLLDAEIKQLYRTSGISHILAISGLHISMIGMTFYRFLRKRSLGFWGAGIFAAVFMVSYGLMTGMGYSSFRAVSMFCILLQHCSFCGNSRLHYVMQVFSFRLLRYLVWSGLEKSFKVHTRGMYCYRKLLWDSYFSL